MMQTDYLKLIDEYTDEMIAVLQELVRIRSVEAEPVETLEKGLLPFGAGVQEAFEYMLAREKPMALRRKMSIITEGI